MLTSLTVMGILRTGELTFGCMTIELKGELIIETESLALMRLGRRRNQGLPRTNHCVVQTLSLRRFPSLAILQYFMLLS